MRDRLRVLLISGEPHPGRAHLAAAAEGRSVGRSGALHHPAPAGEGRPDAAERTGADRLPGARAVPRQDQRVRPDHPGPVPESRPAAAALPRQHRRARARGRRAAAERRAGVLRRDQPGRDAARPGPARRAGVDERGGRGPVPARASPISASAIRSPRAWPAPIRRANPTTQRRTGGHGTAASSRPTCSGEAADGHAATASRCCCWTGSARAASRCCCRIRSGCGRAATRAAARRPNCCAGSRIG